MQVLLGIYSKRFYWILLFPILLLFYVFEVGQAKSWTHKCPNDINTEWAIPENFSSFSMFLFVFYFFTFVFYFTFKCSCFLLYAWKFHILNPSLLPLFVFFHYSVCTVISDCNHPFDTSTFTHTVSQEYIIFENTNLNGVFWNQKFLFFHKNISILKSIKINYPEFQ